MAFEKTYVIKVEIKKHCGYCNFMTKKRIVREMKLIEPKQNENIICEI